jgi:hypothetical protein
VSSEELGFGRFPGSGQRPIHASVSTAHSSGKEPNAQRQVNARQIS